MKIDRFERGIVSTNSTKSAILYTLIVVRWRVNLGCFPHQPCQCPPGYRTPFHFSKFIFPLLLRGGTSEHSNLLELFSLLKLVASLAHYSL